MKESNKNFKTFLQGEMHVKKYDKFLNDKGKFCVILILETGITNKKEIKLYA